MKHKRHELEKLYHKYNDVSVPDADFNPKRNREVLQETINDAERYHNTIHSVIDDALGERIEAVSDYARYRFNRGFKKPKDYFGRELMRKFTGEHLLDKLRVIESVNRLNKNDKYKNFVLL